MACYCCVLGCKNNNHKSKDKHLFRFPKDEIRKKLWQRFARKSVKPTSVICEDHFESRYKVPKNKKLKLTSDAVPTIFFKETSDGLEKTTISFNGEDYFGPEAMEMERAMEISKDQEIVAIEAAFVNEQMKLDDIKTRCRFCAELSNVVIEISCFETYNININNFLHYLNIHIVESDFFPNSVCEACFNQVIVIDTFIVRCKNADKWLWDEIGKLKTISAAVAWPPEAKSVRTSSQGSVHDESGSVENFTEEIIQECVSDGELATDGDLQDADDSEAKPPEAESEQTPKAKKTKLSDFAIMDPRCNKFAMRSYNCEVCLNVFAGLKTFKSHVCDVPEIRCAECGDVFETVFAMSKHRRYLHKGKQQKNYCPFCKTVITGNETVFKKHKTKCDRDRLESIECEPCQKTFTSIHEFTVHQMFHESEKKSEEDVLATDDVKPPRKKSDIVCELCGKTYTTIGDCRRHIKLKHTKITEVFSCDTCNKTYPSKSVLKDHIRNTHVVNEVACTYCGKIFRNKTHLKKHMVYHDDSKRVHKCFICPNVPGFVNKVGLMRHQARHAKSDEKVHYSCEICVNYNFHTSFQLKSHLKHVHGIDQW